MSDADCTPGREPRSVAASSYTRCAKSHLIGINALTFYGNGYGIIVQRGRGLGRGLAPLPRKNITRCKSNYLYHVRTQCAIWCIRAPMRPPSKISTAMKTACERIAPSKSFLGAVYNHGRLYSDYILYWAPLVTISAQWTTVVPKKVTDSAKNGTLCSLLQ